MRFTVNVPSAALLGILLLVAGGCKSTGNTLDPAPDVRDYETFDPAPYQDREPRTEVLVEHDLPAEVVSGASPGADPEGDRRTIPGFRIQIGSDAVRDRANVILQDAEAWVRAEQEDEELIVELPLYIEWDQPYWKVRMGNFRSRRAALEILKEVQVEFPAAFVVPSMVTVE